MRSRPGSSEDSEFQQKFPKVKGERDTFRGYVYALLPKVETLIAGGQPPDGVLCGNYTLALFASLVRRSSRSTRSSRSYPSVNFKDFLPVAQKAVTYQGKIYALP